MAANPSHNTAFKGWHYDKENDRLELWYKGTEVWRVDSSGTTLVTGDFNSQSDDVVLRFGGTVGLSWDTTDANANAFLIQLPAGGATDVPVIAIGQSIESVDLGLYNGAVDPQVALFGVGARTTAPIIEFRKSRGTVDSPTAITTGDDLGTIRAYAGVANDEYVESARIQFDSTGTIATTRGAGIISLQVATDAAPSVLTERVQITGSGAITITPATDTLLANGTGLVVGHTAQITALGGVIPEFQVLGTTAAADAGILVGNWQANNDCARIEFVKSRNATIGSFTIVQDGDLLGELAWLGDDGVDYQSVAASIRARVSGTPGAGDMPSRMELLTTADSAESATIRMTLNETGTVAISDGTVRSHANMTGPGLIIDTRTVDTLGFALKSSSDITTGLTSGAPQTVATDDILTIGKLSAAVGGVGIQGIAEDGAADTSLQLVALGATCTTTDTTSSIGLMNIVIAEHDAANATITAPANQNALTIRGATGAATYETRLLLKGDDGELHLGNSTPVALDSEDDVMLVRAMQKEGTTGGIIENALDNPFYNYDKLHELGIVGEKDPDSGNYLFALQPRLALHEGAMWQLFTDLMEVVKALPAEIQASLPSRIQNRLALV